MTHVLRLAGLGTQVDLQCAGDEADLLARALHVAWSRCLVADPSGAPGAAAVVQCRLDGAADLARRLMLTTQDVTRALVKARRGDLLMLHAGAVAHPVTGQSVVYVAPGGTGKTTLSTRLGRRFGYLTDETVGIDASGGIWPYPKPLSVRGRAVGPKDEVSPEALELLPAPPAPRATRVVLLNRRDGAAPPLFEEVPFMDAVFTLTEQTSALSLLPRPLHRLEALIDAAGPVLRVTYTEAADIEDELARLIGGAA